MRSICHGTPLGGLFHKIPFLIRSWVLRICPLFSTSPSAFDSAPKDRREQMPEEDLVELKFRLYDGSDIGPIRYSSSSTIAMLKERIISEWPRDKKIVPKVANDVKLISAGKILENSKTIAQCRSPFGEPPADGITMHVVVQPSLTKAKTEKKVEELPKKTACSCSIL
ncbi:membrane-anchored ubiquitin-fold protein 4-like isoform X2 [Musa acuminata AAA Group]|uniref:membrane-anchored ubiquitin-fold protein 4-like isoform X2 n=1 Tax=Musa acuminata AAA Group TaxID=214697 RepID=UPI0031D6D0BA